MITALELNKMTPQRRKDFCKTISACTEAWFAADPAREAAYQEWLPKYLERMTEKDVVQHG